MAAAIARSPVASIGRLGGEEERGRLDRLLVEPRPLAAARPPAVADRGEVAAVPCLDVDEPVEERAARARPSPWTPSRRPATISARGAARSRRSGRLGPRPVGERQSTLRRSVRSRSRQHPVGARRSARRCADARPRVAAEQDATPARAARSARRACGRASSNSDAAARRMPASGARRDRLAEGEHRPALAVLGRRAADPRPVDASGSCGSARSARRRRPRGSAGCASARRRRPPSRASRAWSRSTSSARATSSTQ